MTQQPPIPAASQSPYPIEEQPHRHISEAIGYNGDGPEAVAYESRGKDESFSITELLDDYGIDARTAIGIGAAVGLGAIAGISALLFSRRSKRGATKPARAAAVRKPRTTKARAARKPAPKRATARAAAKA